LRLTLQRTHTGETITWKMQWGGSGEDERKTSPLFRTMSKNGHHFYEEKRVTPSVTASGDH